MWCYLNHLLNIIDIFLVTVRVDCSNIGFVVAVFMMFALYWRMNRHVQFGIYITRQQLLKNKHVDVAIFYYMMILQFFHLLSFPPFKKKKEIEI